MNNRWVFGVLIISATSAATADTVGDALRASKFNVDWRVRQETVDQAGIAETADALTSRLRAGVTTGALHSTSLLAEIVLVEDVVDDYNSTVNGLVQYPVVADPTEFAAVNRFALVNKSLPKTTLTLGRQRIALDDHRFVGNVGWRQHEQTFDGLRATRAGSVNVDLTYANQVNRVFGPDSPAGNWHGGILLASFAFTSPIGTLTAFGHRLDLDDATALSSNTVGLKLTGTKPIAGGLSGVYSLTYAAQSEAGANPAQLDADNYALEGGLKFAKLTASAGYEVLSGDGTVSFQTPLATLHAFQGWADKFLSTPADGIRDTYLELAYQTAEVGPFSGIAALAVLHAFDADNGGAHYGDELDLSLIARAERMTFTVKYATYEADELFTDTDKLWLSIDYAF